MCTPILCLIVNERACMRLSLLIFLVTFNRGKHYWRYAVLAQCIKSVLVTFLEHVNNIMRFTQKLDPTSHEAIEAHANFERRLVC